MPTLIGLTDEVTECDCCGRVSLRRTVELDFGAEVGHLNYGTSCAAKILGGKGADVAKRAMLRCSNGCGRPATTIYQSGRRACGPCEHGE